MAKDKRICGKCRFNKRDWTNPKNKDFYCSNEESENYGYNTFYTEGCIDWESKNDGSNDI